MYWIYRRGNFIYQKNTDTGEILRLGNLKEMQNAAKKKGGRRKKW